MFKILREQVRKWFTDRRAGLATLSWCICAAREIRLGLHDDGINRHIPYADHGWSVEFTIRGGSVYASLSFNFLFWGRGECWEASVDGVRMTGLAGWVLRSAIYGRDMALYRQMRSV